MIIGTGNAGEAIQNSERGVPEFDTPAFFAKLDKAHWDDIYLFRTVFDANSLRKASSSSGLAINTIRARISRLEAALGTKLFARTRSGLRLTQEGQSVLALSSELQSLDKKVRRSGYQHLFRRQGQVSLCVSEGIGAFWLTPRLQHLREYLPETRIALHNSLDQNNIHSSPHDFRIGFARPTDKDAIVVKLATIHFVLCASDDYIRRHGTPLSLDDADGHMYIDQDTPGLNYDAVRLFMGSHHLDSLIAFSVNSSFSLYWAVANGQGIAALPTYVRAISKRVRPLDLPVQLRFELWLSYDRSIRDFDPAVRTVRWLKSCFDKHRYPWFRDEFVNPALFEERLDDCSVIPLYDYGIE